MHMTTEAINELHLLTQNNQHTIALVRLAEALQENFLVDQLHIIDQSHSACGYITEAEYQKRYDFKAWLMDKAAEVFDNFAEIKAAF